MPVFTTPQIRVSINNPQRTTVRTIGISPDANARTLTSLTDVDASDPDNNETLVYNSTTQKYEIKVLPGIDGGSY
jgi:hypothetical protein